MDLKRLRIKEDAVLNYGFRKEGSSYTSETKVLHDGFLMKITIQDQELSYSLFDLDFEEDYPLSMLQHNATLRNEVENVIQDIAKKCFYGTTYIGRQANDLDTYIKDTYGVVPSFEWEDCNYGVYKNPNGKWFGLIMDIDWSKLDKNKSGTVEVINIKLDPNEILDLIAKPGFYKAYHMNKKYWISIVLDETVEDEKLHSLLFESISLTK